MSPRAIRTGDTLGRYAIGDELGEGGMATVFRARDAELRRDVAVKVLFPHLARRPEVVHRFQREARAAAGLEHRNILRIYDVGSAQGDDPPFIVMELVRGRTLLTELEVRGPMLSEVATCVGALLADALACAHAAAIVHRDVKPANVLISEHGRVLLADFGVARLETEDSLVTKTGAVLGTPAYMSPEQATGDVATAKSDLYSLGATLYQLATGQLPFTGNAAKIIADITSGTLVLPHKRRASVDPDLSRLIGRMMERDPTRRPASASDVAAELRRLATASGFADPADELAAYFANADAFATARTAPIVSATLARSRASHGAGELPRAMALADRAAALSPSDPEAAAWIEALVAGARGRERRKTVVVGVGVLGTIGAATAIIGAVLAARDAPPGASVPGDAAPLTADAALQAAADATAAPVVPPPADAAPALDASFRNEARDARRPDAPPLERIDAAPSVLSPDAAIPISVDAAIDRAPDAAVVSGAILVRNDTWCDVEIDGTPRGRVFPASARPIEVSPGRRRVTCKGSVNSWTQEVDVAPGQQAVARGRLVELHEVVVEVAMTIDGTPYRAGSTARLAGRVHVEANGTSRFITINARCRLRSDLECYPVP